ncbi:MAG: ABC transporter ATP-binding protein [Eubacteriales bacterium]
MSTLISMKNLYKIYNPGVNEVRALDGIDLEIDEGEFVAIIGHSGSGKSTLMNMIGCLDQPTEGEYHLHGQEVAKMKDDELAEVRNKEIGFIFQGFNLIQNLTALENVELPLIYRGVDRKTRRQLAKEALEKVGLGNRMNHLPAEMSGGQQQRVAVARAVTAAPPLILADEPTGNLDSKSTDEILGILETLYSEGRTVIIITHDSEIAKRAKRVICFKDGIVEKEYDNDTKERQNEDEKTT